MRFRGISKIGHVFLFTTFSSLWKEVLVKQLRVFYNKNDYVIGNKSKKEVPFPQEEVTVTVPA